MKAKQDPTTRKDRHIVAEAAMLIAGVVIALFIGFEFMQRHVAAFFQSLILTMVVLLLSGCYLATHAIQSLYV